MAVGKGGVIIPTQCEGTKLVTSGRKMIRITSGEIDVWSPTSVTVAANGAKQTFRRDASTSVCVKGKVGRGSKVTITSEVGGDVALSVRGGLFQMGAVGANGIGEGTNYGCNAAAK
jgi:hypothetical protein